MEDELIKNVRNDQFAKFVGIRLIEVNKGYAITELFLTENHMNGVNRIQGGVIFTLADYAFAAASNSGGCSTVGLNVNISYYRAPVGKVIRAIAREVSAQNKISAYNVEVTDEDGSLIASFNGLGYRKINK
jgi:acyl-CoA thioesterase